MLWRKLLGLVSQDIQNKPLNISTYLHAGFNSLITVAQAAQELHNRPTDKVGIFAVYLYSYLIHSGEQTTHFCPSQSFLVEHVIYSTAYMCLEIQCG